MHIQKGRKHKVANPFVKDRCHGLQNKHKQQPVTHVTDNLSSNTTKKHE